MFGGDIGTLKVMVNTKNPLLGPHGNWLDSGTIKQCNYVKKCKQKKLAQL